MKKAPLFSKAMQHEGSDAHVGQHRNKKQTNIQGVYALGKHLFIWKVSSPDVDRPTLDVSQRGDSQAESQALEERGLSRRSDGVLSVVATAP